MKKTSKLLITLITSFAFFTIFSAKSNAATIEKIVFDNQFYIASNMDLEKYYGFNDYAGAYEHFNYHGIDEGRAGSPLFDVKYYKEVNKDLSNMTNEEAYEHFIYHGIAEGRTASPLFDVKYYLEEYPDLKVALNSNYAEAYDHYVYHGIYEGRNPSANIELDHYVNRYSDLKKAFVKDGYVDWVGVAEHWFFHGVKENREGLHQLTEGTEKQPTCEAPGKEADIVCSTCGKVLKQGEEIPALGHNFKVQTKEESFCRAKCLNCGLEKTTEHNDENMTEWKADEGAQTHSRKCEICETTKTEACTEVMVVGKAPTCTEAGTESYRDCSVCHRNASKDHTIPALGHDFKYDTTAEGKDQHKCVRTYQVEVEAEGRHWTETKVCGEVEACEFEETIEQDDNENHAIKSTCKVCGHEKEPVKVAHNYEYKISQDQRQHYKQCKDCGYIDESTRKDHDYVYTQLEKIGNYDQHKKVCKTCGKEVARETCSFSEANRVLVPGKSATCEEDGNMFYYACKCGRPQGEIEVIPALGHQLTIEEVEGSYKVKCTRLVRPSGSDEPCLEYGKIVTVESLNEIFNKKLNSVTLTKGNMEITKDIVIPEEVTLKVEEEGNLIIKDLNSIKNVDITNNGKITVYVSTQEEILEVLKLEGNIEIVLEGNVELTDTILTNLKDKKDNVTVSASNEKGTEIKQQVSSAENLKEAIEEGYADEIILDKALEISETLTIENTLKLDAKQSTLKDLNIEADNVEILNAKVEGKLNINGENAVIENTTVTVTDVQNGNNVITISEGAEGATLKNVTAKNDGSQGAALSIECDNVTIEGGDFEMKNESLQGQGAIRIGAEQEIKNLKITNATLKGGIHVLKYTGNLEDLVITGNNITLEQESGAPLSGIIILTEKGSEEEIKDFANALATKNTFDIKNSESFKVLIHDNLTNWDIRAKIENK